jgi:hypothetical protein
MNRNFRACVGAALACICVLPASALADAPDAVPVTAAGSANVTTAVTSFRTALGALNPNVAGTNNSGRREINWDGVPDASAAPNLLPPDFFNTNSPRGVVLVGDNDGLEVSATTASGTAVRFGNINSTYTTSFATFSPERLFAPLGTTVTDVNFYVAGSSRPATVSGFGAVFSDVDVTGRSQLVAIGQFGQVLSSVDVPPASGDVSFAGVRFSGASRISRVRLITGTAPLEAGAAGNDSTTADRVALDDFIYGEPAQPRVSISDAGTITEGDDGTLDATFTVTRDVDASTVLTVPYATLGDSAAQGVDFTGKTGTIAFNAGVTERTITVPVIGDKVDEADESFRVVLLDNGQATIADGEGSAVIADNDPPTVVPGATVTPTPSSTPTTTGYDPAKDKTPPKITASGYPKGKKCAKRDFTLKVSVVEDGLSSLRVKLDRTTLSDRATAAAVSERLKLRIGAKRLKKGKHTFRIAARDRAGNSATRTIRFRRC